MHGKKLRKGKMGPIKVTRFSSHFEKRKKKSTKKARRDLKSMQLVNAIDEFRSPLLRLFLFSLENI